MEGLKVTFITAPEGGYKSEGNPFESLSPETEDHYKARCGEYYQGFLKALSRGRGVKAATIDKDWGRGRMMGAQAAKNLGIVDRIGTVQGEIDRMAQAIAKRGGRGVRAEAEIPVIASSTVEASVAEQSEAVEVEVATEEWSTVESADQTAHDLALAHLRLVGA
jgi:ClpP class serine protease